jgi:iron complex outermembrane receptor protein
MRPAPPSPAVLVLILALAARAPAQETTTKPEEPPRKQPEVIIHATPIVESTEVSPYGDSAVRVGDEQIDLQNAQDLATALSRVPGVTMTRHNIIGAFGGGEGGAFYIRGHGSGRPGAEILIYMDGVPKFSGVFSHPLLDMVPIDAAETIEVYKSPQPVLLGASGFAAVNLIPKRRLEDGVEARALYELGSYDTQISSFEVSARADPWDGFFVGSHRDSDGHREDAGGVVDSAYGRVGATLGGGWDLSAQVMYSTSSVEDPLPIGSNHLPFTPRFITDDRFGIFTFSHRMELIKSSLKVYVDDGLQDWEQWDPLTSTVFDSITTYTNYGARLREILNPWAGGEIIAGADLDFYGGEFVEERSTGNFNETDKTFRDFGTYAMIRHTLDGGGWTLTPSAGLRYNFSKNFHDEPGYQAGLVLSLAPVTLHFQYARTANYPGVYTLILFNGAGWEDLEPERVDHYEAGVEVRLGEKAKVNVTAFHDDVENGLRVVLPPPPPARYLNVGEYMARGGEISLEARPLDSLDLFLGATYTHNDPKDLPYSPPLTAAGGLHWRFLERFRLSANMNFYDDQYLGNVRSPAARDKIDDYLVINARLGYFPPIPGNAVKSEIFLAGDNLTDAEPELRAGYPIPGMTFMGGIDVRF